MLPNINISIESGIHYDVLNGFGIRRVRVTGFKSTFILAKVFVEDTKYYKYVIMEESTGLILLTARTIHNALFELDTFLRPLEQPDIDLLISESFG